MFTTGFILFINGMEKPHYKTPMGKSQRNQGWITLPGSDIILPPLYRAVTTAHTSDTPPKNICLVLIIMSISLKWCVLKPNQFKLLIYVFWAHTSEACAQKAAVTRLVLFLVLLRLNCQILKTHVSYKNTVGYVCEGKKLGKKLHVYIRSVY